MKNPRWRQSRSMAIKELLEEIIADRDSELTDQESEDISENNGDSSGSGEINKSSEKVECFEEHNSPSESEGRESEKEHAVLNRGHGRGRSGHVGGTKMSPKGVKFLKFCKKYFCLQNPIWPPVAWPVPGLALKGLN